VNKRVQRYVCRGCGFGVGGDSDGHCIECGLDCAIVEVVYSPEDWPILGACGAELLGTEDDPSGAWECSLIAGHEGEHCDGDNGRRWPNAGGDFA